MSQLNRIRSTWAVAGHGLLLAVTLVALEAGVARACSTPVYRYAMYNWSSAPYYVFFFHQDEIAQADKSVNELLDTASRAEPAPANVTLESVDVSQEEQLQRLPEVVRESRESHSDGTAPLYLVYSPWGVELYAGRLDSAEVRAMIDSPVRKRLGELLKEGNAAVLLVLTGPDVEKNRQAEKVATEVAAQASAGKIPVGLDPGFAPMPEQPSPEMPDDSDDEATDDEATDDGLEGPSGGMKLAVLKVSRTDPAEKWLVRTLLSVEPDLNEFPEEAMVFAVYGRGRAMPPYVGKGITAENLVDCLMFLAGPCSCMVKDDNPGMDLLMQWDWGATAEAMAAQDESFGGGPLGYQEFIPDESYGEIEVAALEGDQAQPAPADDPAPEAAQTSTAEGAPSATEDGPSTTEDGPSTTEDALSTTEDALSDVAEEPLVEDAAVTKQPPQPQPESFAVRQNWKLGLGVAAGAFFVLAVSLVLVLRQRPS